MQNFQQTNILGLKKDKNTGVIISDDTGKYEMIIGARKKAKEQQSLKKEVHTLHEACSNLSNKFESLQNDIREIREFLESLK